MADIRMLKDHVSEFAGQDGFVHRAWFVAHHLEIIEGIVEELLSLYPQADATVARAMVWVHDWGKIVTNKGPDEEAVTRQEVRLRLPQCGFTEAQIETILRVYDEMESLEPRGDDFLLETKIISSADALAHYVGPFFALYWWENPQKTVDGLIADNVRKVKRDMKKVLLPEVRVVAEPRMKLLLENHPAHRPAAFLQGQA